MVKILPINSLTAWCKSKPVRAGLGGGSSRFFKNSGAVMGYGVALQASCLEGFDSLGLHQSMGFYSQTDT